MARTAQCRDFASVQPFNRRSDRTYANVHGGACERRSGGCRSGVSGLVGNATGGARSRAVPFQNDARGEVRRDRALQHARARQNPDRSARRCSARNRDGGVCLWRPSLLSGETIENVARGIDCETIRQAARRLRRDHAV